MLDGTWTVATAPVTYLWTQSTSLARTWMSFAPWPSSSKDKQRTLAHILADLPQPLCICYPHSKRTHFMLDLKRDTFQDTDASFASCSFRVDTLETADCCAVFRGRMLCYDGTDALEETPEADTDNRWEVRITQPTEKSLNAHRAPHYEATVIVGDHEPWTDHVVWCLMSRSSSCSL